MNISNSGWEPGFGTIYTWFAMDKKGKVALMVNNCWGWLPNSILSINGFENVLDDLNEFKWEESEKYTVYPENKNGKTILDLYSHLEHKNSEHRASVEQWVDKHQNEELNEINMPSRKGFFVYHGVKAVRKEKIILLVLLVKRKWETIFVI